MVHHEIGSEDSGVFVCLIAGYLRKMCRQAEEM
jgi:hypothetical protein